MGCGTSAPALESNVEQSHITVVSRWANGIHGCTQLLMDLASIVAEYAMPDDRVLLRHGNYFHVWASGSGELLSSFLLPAPCTATSNATAAGDEELSSLESAISVPSSFYTHEFSQRDPTYCRNWALDGYGVAVRRASRLELFAFGWDSGSGQHCLTMLATVGLMGIVSLRPTKKLPDIVWILPQGRILAVTDQFVVVLRVADEHGNTTVVGTMKHSADVLAASVAVSEDGRRMVSFDGFYVRLWSLESFAQLACRSFSENDVSDVKHTGIPGVFYTTQVRRYDDECTTTVGLLRVDGFEPTGLESADGKLASPSIVPMSDHDLAVPWLLDTELVVALDDKQLIVPRPGSHLHQGLHLSLWNVKYNTFRDLTQRLDYITRPRGMMVRQTAKGKTIVILHRASRESAAVIEFRTIHNLTLSQPHVTFPLRSRPAQ